MLRGAPLQGEGVADRRPARHEQGGQSALPLLLLPSAAHASAGPAVLPGADRRAGEGQGRQALRQRQPATLRGHGGVHGRGHRGDGEGAAGQADVGRHPPDLHLRQRRPHLFAGIQQQPPAEGRQVLGLGGRHPHEHLRLWRVRPQGEARCEARGHRVCGRLVRDAVQSGRRGHEGRAVRGGQRLPEGARPAAAAPGGERRPVGPHPGRHERPPGRLPRERAGGDAVALQAGHGQAGVQRVDGPLVSQLLDHGEPQHGPWADLCRLRDFQRAYPAHHQRRGLGSHHLG
mmetsp:Transcript_46067/g.121715  ORF Transcript_46067/g.121715 Transcript_46067/m.121715 type:complete len:288 (+) Transcript_46067:741-1604(+)